MDCRLESRDTDRSIVSGPQGELRTTSIGSGAFDPISSRVDDGESDARTFDSFFASSLWCSAPVRGRADYGPDEPWPFLMPLGRFDLHLRKRLRKENSIWT